MLLDNPKVLRWCYEAITPVSLMNTGNERKLEKYKQIEKRWGNNVMHTRDGKQWTTKLCQDVVAEALVRLGRKNVRKIGQIKSSVRDKYYDPDLECDKYIYEVKGRSWTTPGTAGEKILGVPLKYGELPRLSRKPLQIVLVGYQEYEARQCFGFGDLFDSNKQTPELKQALKYHRARGISYVGFTDILEEIGLPNGVWRRM